MPLFRFIDPPSHLEDASFAYDTNPDPKKFAEVAEVPEPAPEVKPAKSTKPAAEAVETTEE